MKAFHAGLVLLAAAAVLVGAVAIRLIANEWSLMSVLLVLAGLLLAAVGGYFLRVQLRAGMTRRRGEIALFAVGACAVLVVLGALVVPRPAAFRPNAATVSLAVATDARHALAATRAGPHHLFLRFRPAHDG